jgi:hypothetical protein
MHPELVAGRPTGTSPASDTTSRDATRVCPSGCSLVSRRTSKVRRMAAPPHCQNPQSEGYTRWAPASAAAAATSPAEAGHDGSSRTCHLRSNHRTHHPLRQQTLGWTTHGRAIPSRLTAGPGWCWPATPSCAWPASSLATSGCRGNGPDPSRTCRPIGCAVGFRGCWSGWARRRVRRNPPDTPPAGPRVGPPGPRSATLHSRSRPRSPETGRPGPQEPPDQPSPSSRPVDLGRRSARHPPG